MSRPLSTCSVQSAAGHAWVLLFSGVSSGSSVMMVAEGNAVRMTAKASHRTCRVSSDAQLEVGLDLHLDRVGELVVGLPLFLFCLVLVAPLG